MKQSLQHFNNLLESLMALPSIGKKGAKNLAFYLVTDGKFDALKLAHHIEEAAREVKLCTKCNNLSENELCDICANDERDGSKLCIVFSAKDLFTIEESGFYNGRYFVCNENIDFDKLLDLIRSGVKEVIFAFSPSIQNDATIYYIEEHLKGFDLIFSKIAQGVPTGVSLESVDMLSLARALEGRVKV